MYQKHKHNGDLKKSRAISLVGVLVFFALLASTTVNAATYAGEKYPATRKRILRAAEVRKWGATKQRYALDEIYARHGYVFTNKSTLKHFLTYNWYKPLAGRTLTDVNTRLTSIERANASLLVKTIRGERGYANSTVIGDTNPKPARGTKRKPVRKKKSATAGSTVEVGEVPGPARRRNRGNRGGGTVSSDPGDSANGPTYGSTSRRGRLTGEKFPTTKSKVFSDAEIGNLSNSQVRYALNEIYARHGYAFPQPALRKEFGKYAWYKPLTTRSKETIENSFNRFEAQNALLLSQEIDNRSNDASGNQTQPQ